MKIEVQRVARGWVWRFYIASLDRAIAESAMTFPRYDTAVKDAKLFRKTLQVEVDIPIRYETPKGKVKII